MERFWLIKQTLLHISVQSLNENAYCNMAALCVSCLDFKVEKWYNDNIQEYAITYDIKGE